MIKQSIKVVILDNGARINECGVGCGESWDSEEAIDLARQRVKNRFGERIRLEYHDLSKFGVASLSLKLQKKIEDETLSLPLLVINGEAKISGQFDIRLLLDAIEAEIEIGW